MNLKYCKLMICQPGIRFCICFMLLCILFISSAAQSSKPHSEVWELKSLKKIGGHKAEVFGNPEVVKTDRGKAIKFDGIDDRLLVDNNPLGDATEFTVEVIFKAFPAYEISNQPRFVHFQDPDDTLAKRVMVELRLTQSNEWYLDGYMLTDKGERTLQNKTLTHPIGEWYHAALTYKDNTFKTFVNGIEEVSGSVSFDKVLVNKIGKVSLGGRMDQRNYYCGLIKTLKITRKALEPKDFIY
jgi:hypothetical protein